MKLESNERAKKIALYIRVSTEEQAENPEGSIKNQKERLQQAVEIKNLGGPFGEIVGIYTDSAKSGGNTNRKALQEMLQAIKRKEINLVMASELSRISRSMKDFSEIWEMMKAHGCGFQSLRENFDTTTAAGEMVLYTIASFAQFERRQCSERVAANFKARAQRGLYNGGPVPLGYTRNLENKGQLLIENEYKGVIQAAFNVFLREETLSQTAKELNRLGYKLKRAMEGGGGKSRLDFFTADNLHKILRNKTYIGIRIFRDSNGKLQEAKGAWEPIVDVNIFERVQKLLSKNRSAKKSHSEKRYPYLLTGLTFCEKCKNAMCGKSAHGNGGKIPYYEHSWATKRNAALSKKIFQCEPHRIPARKLEALALEKVQELLDKPEVFTGLIRSFEKVSSNNPLKRERDRIKAQIHGLNSQLEALAERLSFLPKEVSSSVIFKQMEKVEAKKTELEKIIPEASSDMPAKPNDVIAKELFARLRLQLLNTEDSKLKAQIMKRLIHKIEIGVSSVRIHYYVGKNYLTEELEALEASGSEGPSKNLLFDGSNSLTNGAG